MTTQYQAFLGMGSSTGDRLGTLRSALRSLSQTPGIEIARASAVYATSPVGPASQEFFNAALQVCCSVEPQELLKILLGIEQAHGRERRIRWDDRSLDLDLLLMARSTQGACNLEWLELQSPALTLPHPRICERDFVLRPLADLSEDLRLKGYSIAHWLSHIDPADRSIRRRVCDARALLFSLRACP